MAILSKERLVAIAKRLMSDQAMSRDEANRLIDDFEASTYPQATEFMFNWTHKFKNTEEIIDFLCGDLEMEKLNRDELGSGLK